MLLSLDLSTVDTGYAIYQEEMIPYVYGNIAPKKIKHKNKKETIDDLYNKMVQITLGVEDLIKHYNITKVVFEDSFCGINRQVVVKLNRLAGMIIYLCYTYNIPFSTISPKQAKKTFAGNGNATKEDMINTVKEKFNLDIKNDNICDAIGIGYSYKELGD